MAANIRSTVFAALAAALVVACTAQAEAQFRLRLYPRVRLAPSVVVATPTIAYPAPYLGFDSFFDGCGEQVTAVQYGTAAWRMGLEPGDTIIAVNGIPIRYQGHGMQLVRAAAYQGHITLSVRDCNTGLVAHRAIGLGNQAVIMSGGSYVVQRHHHQPSLGILRRFPH